MRRTAMLAALALTACGDNIAPVDGCQIVDPAHVPDGLLDIGCRSDFDALAASFTDGTLPGASSVKVILDQADHDRVHFENTNRFINHWGYARGHLSGNGLPAIADEGMFYGSSQFSPDRRFILGDVTYYAGADRWVLEMAPYDTASPAQLGKLYAQVAQHIFVGDTLGFHPTSNTLAATAAAASPAIPIVTTDELYAGIDYQPLSLATAYGRLHFTTAAALAHEYVSYQDIVVLDSAPNDISVVQGIITEEFQTPLSHINVLSRNRHAPNMGLRGAQTDPTLRALDGKLVQLVVDREAWSIREASAEEAQAWWDTHGPPAVTVPAVDNAVTTLTPIAAVAPEAPGRPLRDSIVAAVPAFGGKAAHYGVLVRTPGVPIRDAFAIPASFYTRFMADNGFTARVAALSSDPSFATDPAQRDAALTLLRADMRHGTLAPELASQLTAMIAARFPRAAKLRFRSSSNTEDLDGFPCAGCYESHSGDADDLNDILDAIRQDYASVWSFRAYELRSYYRVDHAAVGMALLVHESFPDEEANGVAVTQNPLAPPGVLAFYVNVQEGDDVEVVSPPPGVTSDQFLYYYDLGETPILEYVTHSSLVPAGTTVLDAAETQELGDALAAIRSRFSAAYGPDAGNSGWYAMDVEFKFDDADAPGQRPHCYVKQARPYPAP